MTNAEDIEVFETDFHEVVDNGNVVEKDSYHQPDERNMNHCGCDLTTSKGAYRDVIVEYDDITYYFYHQTPVVLQVMENKYVLNNGGYKTKSTRKRINQRTPSNVDISKSGGRWFVKIGKHNYRYINGMMIDTKQETILAEIADEKLGVEQ